MKGKTNYSILIIGFIVCQIFLQMAAFGESTILFTFNNNSEEWVGYEGPVNRVESPSVDGNGSLRVSVSAIGRGWSDNTFESPEINRDMSQYSEIRIQVFVPSVAPSDIKGQIFTKSGPNYTWRDNGWVSLQKDQWTTLSIPSSRIEHIRNVRTIGIKIGSNNKWNGPAYIDRVEALHTQVGQVKPSIRILEIVENSHIVGRVTGLDPSQYDQYKVLVYVKTDKWYIHPYERGGEGLSFAKINRDGSWSIGTVKRQFLADLVAALLVRKDYAPPSIVNDLRQIDTLASYTEQGRGKL